MECLLAPENELSVWNMRMKRFSAKSVPSFFMEDQKHSRLDLYQDSKQQLEIDPDLFSKLSRTSWRKLVLRNLQMWNNLRKNHTDVESISLQEFQHRFEQGKIIWKNELLEMESNLKAVEMWTLKRSNNVAYFWFVFSYHSYCVCTKKEE